MIGSERRGHPGSLYNKSGQEIKEPRHSVARQNFKGNSKKVTPKCITLKLFNKQFVFSKTNWTSR